MNPLKNFRLFHLFLLVMFCFIYKEIITQSSLNLS
nr:MAG TPA: hypothetical protein [Caudoviricetes sp.]